jgi:hypothetical protein
MDRKYYILWYRLDGRDSYLIWYSDDIDGIIVDENGNVHCFTDVASLQAYADTQHISIVAEEPILHNLDAIDIWLKKGSEAIDPESFLAVWNLFTDIAHSVEGHFDLRRELTQSIYDKLFWGSNPTSVKPEGEEYHPIWTESEIQAMRNIFQSGLELFRRSVKRV